MQGWLKINYKEQSYLSKKFSGLEMIYLILCCLRSSLNFSRASGIYSLKKYSDKPQYYFKPKLISLGKISTAHSEQKDQPMKRSEEKRDGLAP